MLKCSIPLFQFVPTAVLSKFHSFRRIAIEGLSSYDSSVFKSPARFLSPYFGFRYKVFQLLSSFDISSYTFSIYFCKTCSTMTVGMDETIEHCRSCLQIEVDRTSKSMPEAVRFLIDHHSLFENLNRFFEKNSFFRI